MDNDKLMSASLDAARRGDWQRAIDLARQVPKNWDVWQQFPSIALGDEGQGAGLPDSAVHAIMDVIPQQNLPGFLYEYSTNLPPTAGVEVLGRVADAAKEDYLTTDNVTQHPNFKLDPHSKALKNASDFWATYETEVGAHHFAVVKSLFTGRPEEVVDHRGQSGSSEQHIHLLPDLSVYAQEVQRAVLHDANDRGHQIRYFGAEPHIKVYRGVGGRYAAAISKAANYDPVSGKVDGKNLRIPTSHLTSWSTDPTLAHRFATTRATDQETANRPEHQVGVVVEKWMPVKNILHSGYHTVVPSQNHPHADEEELVFGHMNEHVKVPTTSIHFLSQPTSEQGYQYPWGSKRGVARPSPSTASRSPGALHKDEQDTKEPYWWHGTPSGDMRGGSTGLHIGTKKAATEALTARIGHPVEGSWDGTREYGKTLLAGKKTLRARGIYPTGYSAELAPEEDFYADSMPRFSTDVPMLPTHKPIIFPVAIVGKMSNTPQTPHADFAANSRMKSALQRGVARRGYYYANIGEDAGNISAVLPGPEHVRRLDGLGKSEVEIDPHVVVAIVAQDGLGRILWGRKRSNKKWCVPAGHVNLNEHPVDGAKRELGEETGLIPRQMWLVGSGNTADGPIYVYYCVVDGTVTLAHDPDNEFAQLIWVDCLRGLPDFIRMNLAHAPDLVCELMGWQ